jgi:DNA-binding transcriptional MocR family regulator
MSRQARDWAWALDRVTPTQKFVILALAERADESGICWPSLRRLSAMTLLARSTVVLALGALEAGGLITRERGGSGRSTIYRICVPGGEGGTPPSRAPAPGPRHAPVYAPAVRAPDRASPPDGPHRPAGGRTLARQVDTNRHKNRHITVSEPSYNRQ